MKILIVGSDRIFAIENFYVKYLRELGEEVSHLSVQTLFYEYYDKSILNRVIFKAGLSSIYSSINKAFKSKVEEVKPEIIWVFKGMEIYPESLQWAKEQNIVLVNYNPDNPFIFTGKGSGNLNITRSMGLYDMHFTYNLEVMRIMQDSLKARTAYLPFGFDVSQALFESCSQQDEINEVCFLGNPDRNRVDFIRSLLETGVSISVYGNNWSRSITHNRVKVSQPVYGNEQWKVLRKFRIQLNLMRPHNLDSHNMRTFEVPGIGGIMLAPETTEHKSFFDEGTEALYFKNIHECTDKINALLSLSSDQANRIRMAARGRSLKSGYRYEDRAKQVQLEFRSL